MVGFEKKNLGPALLHLELMLGKKSGEEGKKKWGGAGASDLG